MPRPSDVHQNKALENISVAYLQEQTAYVAMNVFPRVPVTKDSDAYFLFNDGDFLREGLQERAPSTQSAGLDYDLTTDTYSCKRFAAHMDVDWNTQANQDGELVTDRAIMGFLTQQALIKLERYWASKYFTTSVWTGSSTGTDIVIGKKWNTAGSTPVADVMAQKKSVKDKCGKKPNVMVVAENVHLALLNNNDILSRLSATERAVVTEAILAQLFGVDKYIVGEAVYNTAAKGAADSLSSILGVDGVLLAYAAPQPNIMIPSAGYVFASKQFASNDWGLIARKWDMTEITSTRYEVEFKMDAKVVCATAGAFISDAV